MLIVKRKISLRGNSHYVNVPMKEISGDEVVVMDLEAYNSLINRN